MKHSERRKQRVEQLFELIKKQKEVTTEEFIAKAQMSYGCMRKTVLEYLETLKGTGVIDIENGTIRAV